MNVLVRYNYGGACQYCADLSGSAERVLSRLVEMVNTDCRIITKIEVKESK